MNSKEERIEVARILDKRGRGKVLSDREQAILANSPYAYAAGCRCKK